MVNVSLDFGSALGFRTNFVIFVTVVVVAFVLPATGLIALIDAAGAVDGRFVDFVATMAVALFGFLAATLSLSPMGSMSMFSFGRLKK